MIDTDFLHGLEKFNLIIQKRVTSNYSGPRKSIAVGRGMLYKDHRIYAPGDDIRSVDWKIYARTDDLMIKNYEEERNLTIHILVDKSLSMKFGKPTKFDYASMLAVGYAYLAMKGNDKFQFATFSDDLEVYQPRRGKSQLIAMVDYLNRLKPNGKTDILSMAQRYRKMIGSRSLIVLISDFMLPVDDLRQMTGYLGNNQLHLIQVLDPIERHLEVEGDFKLQDSETQTLMRTYLSAQSREQYIKRLEQHTAAIEHECDILGNSFTQTTTDTPIFDSFYKILGK